MSDLKGLRCFNPTTGKRDGGYCVWEGKGKCMKCESADKIDDLTKQLSDCEQDKGNLVEAVKYLRESTSGTAQWHTALRLLWAALPQENKA